MNFEKKCAITIFIYISCELSKYQGKIDARLRNISGSLSHQSRGCFTVVTRFPPVNRSNQLNVSVVCGVGGCQAGRCRRCLATHCGLFILTTGAA